MDKNKIKQYLAVVHEALDAGTSQGARKAWYKRHMEGGFGIPTPWRECGKWLKLPKVYTVNSRAKDEACDGVNELLAEHRKVCKAKKGNCPFEKKLDAPDSIEGGANWGEYTGRARKNLIAHGYSEIDEDGYGIKKTNVGTERHPPAVVKWDSEHRPSGPIRKYLAQHEPMAIKKIKSKVSDIHAGGGYKAVYRMLGGMPGVVQALRGQIMFPR